jgi:molybdate transport system substrate-binding protein
MAGGKWLGDVRRARWKAIAIGVAAAILAAGCGGEPGAAGRAKPAITVSAAASLKEAFTRYGRSFDQARVRFSFAGSDELAAQIRQGVRPDVFAAANTSIPAQLHAAGLVERPTVFAANRLVLAVPAHSGDVRSLADLERAGTTIAVASPSVPVGSYTRRALARLPAAQRSAILANVRSNEPDVAGVVGKVAQGAVDAGFVYATDVEASSGELEAVALPPRLAPRVAYGVAVVRGAGHRAQAQAFVRGLRVGTGARELERAGFEPPPSGS